MRGHDQFRARFSTYPERVERATHAVAREAAEIGAERMREVIDTSGTGFRGRGPGDSRSPGGGETTGNMLASVDALKRSSTGTTRSGAPSKTYTFGYVRGRIEDYFHYQDGGFNNLLKIHPSADGGPAGYTLGTEALAAGLYAAREHLRANLPKEVRKA